MELASILSEIRAGESWHASGLIFPRKSIPLHAMLVHCGYETRTAADHYHFHGLNRGNSEFAIWQYTVSGCGVLNYENTRYLIPAGTAMLLHVPHDHFYYFSPEHGTHWSHVHLTLCGHEVLRIMRSVELECGPLLSLSDEAPSVRNALATIAQLREGFPRSPFEVSACAYAFAMSLCEDGLQSGSKNRNGSGEQFFRSAMQYCMSHLAEEITVEDLAAACGYSRFHFSRLFTKATGTSPAKFILDLRLKQAFRLLQLDRRNIKEISSFCGFNDESYFCKLFKRKFGTSPGAFRSVHPNGIS